MLGSMGITELIVSFHHCTSMCLQGFPEQRRRGEWSSHYNHMHQATVVKATQYQLAPATQHFESESACVCVVPKQFSGWLAGLNYHNL